MERSRPEQGDRTITGADFLQLDVNLAPAGTMAGWLADRIRGAIADGRLPVGARLPASRTLASDLGTSRGVVTEAYRRLTEDGHVTGRGRGGTVVVGTTGTVGSAGAGTVGTVGGGSTPTRRPSTPRPPHPSARGMVDFDGLRSAAARIDLSPGLPDLSAFPRAAWLRAERAVLSRLGNATLGYGDPAGVPEFRQQVAEWLAGYRGIRADPARIVIVAGVAQALSLLARVLVARGVGPTAVEDPGSFGARRQLQSWGMRCIGVPVDDAGLRVADLRATDAMAALVSPAHQFPTGVVLDGARRRELLEWADDGGVIIEDDYDAEHRYDRPPVPALAAVEPERVCYAGSVSKILAPALRVGWLLVPSALYDDVVLAKRETDLGNPALAQLVLAQLMRTGELERQLRMIRRRHRVRRDAMIAALKARLPAARIHGAAAGLHLMITFDDAPEHRLSDVEVAGRALRAGVKVQPLSWHRQRPGPPGLVLGYAACGPDEITEGIDDLARVVRAALASVDQ